MIKPPLQLTRVFIVAALLFATVVSPFLAPTASAAQITARSLTLVEGANDLNGGSRPGGVVNHQFTFSVPSSTNVGSVRLQYCTEAGNGACVMPEGLVTTSATLGSNTGAISGLTLVNTTNGTPYLTRTAASVTPGSVTIRLNSVTNPNVTTPSPKPNYTFFVRIATFTSTDTTGSPIDTGTVAASTANPINLTGTMPESLVFCTGANIDTNATGGVGTTGDGKVPDCTTATAGNITFSPALFSPQGTSFATSQMSASTNAGTGYTITVNGSTLTSGSNTINALATPTASTPSTSQFGMNLVNNATPDVGYDVDEPSNELLLRGKPQPDYNTADQFTYVDGAVVAKSDHLNTGYATNPLPTDAQIFTASYIVNVPGSQPAGDYTSTLTYICTPTF